MTNQPPRILTEPLPENNVPARPGSLAATQRQSRVLSRRELRAITRKLVWAYIAQKSVRPLPTPQELNAMALQKKVAKAR